MIDLFETSECHKAERAGILEFDTSNPRQTAGAMAERSPEASRHQCEVRSVAAMYRDHGKDAVIEFLEMVDKHRGKEAMERLRIDALKALKGL